MFNVRDNIKKILKKAVISVLEVEAKLILRKFKPKIVGVTGSVGKTSTKDAIYSVMKEAYSVRKSEKSYNSELGVPLTVIGCHTAWGSLAGWLHIIYRGLEVYFTEKNYPEWLVLEIGADRPGDIRKVVKWVHCSVAVVTYLPEIPVHVEFFHSKEQVIKEKLFLPKSIASDGLIIANADDANLADHFPEFKGKIITYGYGEDANVRASEDHISYEEKEGWRQPVGMAFKLDYGGKNLPVHISGALGHHLVYPYAAAAAVGFGLGINPVTVIEALSRHESPPGRLRVLEGIKNTTILDDTYNASPAAVKAGLGTLEEVRALGRKIAVLGDMLELGSFTIDAHRAAGVEAAKASSIIIGVGVRSKFLLEAAAEKRFSKKNVYHFDNSIQAAQKIQDLIQPGDVIYVKGSQSMRMEKIVEEIMLHPEEREKLLVRQDEEWKRR